MLEQARQAAKRDPSHNNNNSAVAESGLQVMGRSLAEAGECRDLVLPPSLLQSDDSRELVSWLAKDVVTTGPDVAWEAVIGHAEARRPCVCLNLAQAKQSLHDCVTLPLSFPNIFASLRTSRMFSNSVSSLLLFGPPGTGKTMLAKVTQESSTPG